MSYTALLPLKAAALSKSRLRDRLSGDQRAALSEDLFRRAVAALEATRAVTAIRALSPEQPARWRHGWSEDRARGLNAELADVRDRIDTPRLLVVLPDLPFVTPDDIAALIAASRDGPALASDRHGTGTNAVALAAPHRFAFRFGSDSLSRHRECRAALVTVVERHGLAFDIDTGADLDLAESLGFRMPSTA